MIFTEALELPSAAPSRKVTSGVAYNAGKSFLLNENPPESHSVSAGVSDHSKGDRAR